MPSTEKNAADSGWKTNISMVLAEDSWTYFVDREKKWKREIDSQHYHKLEIKHVSETSHVNPSKACLNHAGQKALLGYLRSAILWTYLKFCFIITRSYIGYVAVTEILL